MSRLIACHRRATAIFCLSLVGGTVGSVDAQAEPVGAETAKIAFAGERSGNGDLYVVEDDGSGLTRLTATRATEDDPAWSPDGTRIAFTRRGEIHLVDGNGTGESALTADEYCGDVHPTWSPNGKRIAFQRHHERFADIWVMNQAGARQRTVVRGWSSREPAWSPDGRGDRVRGERLR